MDSGPQEQLLDDTKRNKNSSSSVTKPLKVATHPIVMKSTAGKTEGARKEETETHSIRNVVAVFVARFDVHRGNIIEWQYPQADFDLDGVEYQAMCSGLHRVQSDLIYFSKSHYFGLSFFRNVPVDGNRGACMKAVGVLVVPTPETGRCGEVWRHSGYLKEESSRQMDLSTEDYSSLINYYQQHRIQEEAHFEYFHHKRDEPVSATSPLLSPSATTNGILAALEGESEELNSINYHLSSHADISLTTETRGSGFLGKESSHLAHEFPDFVRQFGPNIFVLWKAMLLKKRVMFLSAPPMERLCSFGTADAIFESKNDLYDVLVTLPAPTFSNVHSATDTTDLHNNMNTDKHFPLSSLHICPQVRSDCRSICPKYNTADFARFRILWRIFSAAQQAGVLPSEENNPLDTTLSDILSGEQKDIKGTIGAMMMGGWFWWYGQEADRTNASGKSVLNGSTSQACTTTSWQRIFAGATSTRRSRPRRKQKRRNMAPEEMPMDPEEQQALLLGSHDTSDLIAEEQDAIEINNNDLFNVVAARSSNTSLSSAQPAKQQVSSGAIEKLQVALIGFFHLLSFHMLSTLETILSLNEQENSSEIVLYPQDMARLGLDAQGDSEFVSELAMLYYSKQARVASCFGTSICNCCPTKDKGRITI
ncbi:hypothetical protein EC973_007118 [Apophysomyces ossiformis]|uniref:Uncharacterized protein n=1 Tax=Apophysomyces ossiformis TaxID=679940 RepID=A0A8H7BZC1_9FUNG|nr:hypothetical protein EC973_007118 [Apophysomyces ossiformis]